MSTRAIIGIELPNGKVKGTWIWCDGTPDSTGAIIRQTLKEKEDVLKVLSYGNLSSLLSDRNKEHFQSQSYFKDRTFVKIKEGLWALDPKSDRIDTDEEGYYEDIEAALERDISYLYIFNEKAPSKWVTYRWDNKVFGLPK